MSLSKFYTIWRALFPIIASKVVLKIVINLNAWFMQTFYFFNLAFVFKYNLFGTNLGIGLEKVENKWNYTD